MKTAIFTIAFIGFAQCAKLDHLQYLPPDNRPAQQEPYDQGLAAPTTGQSRGSFGNSPQPQTDSVSVEVQPTASGSYNADSQNAARLRGSPFIPHGPQSSSGTFSSVQASQPSQKFPTGQQAFNEPQATNEPPVVSSTFSSTYPGSQAGAEPQNRPQGPFGSEQNKVSFSGPQGTSRFQGSSVFGGTQASARPQPTNQPQGYYKSQESETNVSNDVQSSGPYGLSHGQGSTAGQSSTSSYTFPGATGSGTGLSNGSPFAKGSPVVNNIKPQTASGVYGAGTQSSRGFPSSTAVGKDVSSTASYSSGPQSTQTSSVIGGQQLQGPQSPGRFGSTAGSLEPTYSQSNQAPQSFGSGKSTGLSSGGHFTPTQSKYESSSLNQIPIIRLDTKNYGDGTYSTAYETGNGIQAEEQGQTQGDSSIAQGSFSYTSPEGEKVGVSYTADEDGYHPQGEHLPTPPPVPEAILKSLEYNKAHPEEDNDDGSYRDADSNDLGGQYKSPYSKSQFSGASNKYLAPTSSSGIRNQFSGSSSPLARGSTTGSTSGNISPSSGEPSSNQAPFASRNYQSSSVSNEAQDKTGSPVVAPGSSHNRPSFQQSGNTQTSAPSTFQYQASSSDSPNAGPSSGNFKGSNAFQTAPANQPTGMSSFVSHSNYNPSSNAPSGLKTDSFIGQNVNIPQGPFNSQNSIVHESNSPKVPNENEESYVSSGVSSPDPNVPQRIPSNQFPSHGSINRPATESGAQYRGSFGSSSPSAPHDVGSGQTNFKYSNNGPVGASGATSNSGSSRYGPEAADIGNKQYSGLARSQEQQNTKPSYSSGPSAAKSAQFGGYQYNAPNTPLRKAGPSTSQQGGPSRQSTFQQGGISGQPTFQQSGPSGDSTFQRGDLSGKSTFQKSGPSGQPTFQQDGLSGDSTFQRGGLSGESTYQNSGPSEQSTFQQGGLVGDSTFQRGGLSRDSTFQKSGPSGQSTFQQGGPSRDSKFQQGGLSGPKVFPGNTQAREGQSNTKFGPKSGPSKVVGEFGPEVFRGHSGPTVKTPGVQQQDENGGYLY